MPKVRMRISIGLIILTFLQHTFCIGQEQATFSLRHSIDFAQQNSKIIGIAKENVEQAEAKVDEAVSTMLPKLSSQNSYAYFIKPIVILDEKTIMQIRQTFKGIMNPTPLTDIDIESSESIESDPHNFRISATLQQPLFTWGKLINNYKVAKLNLEAAQQNLESVKQQVAFEATKALFGVLLAKEYIRVSAEAVQQVEKHLKIANDLKNAGVSTNYEVLRASVQLANSRSQLIRSQNAYNLAIENFKLIVGMSLETDAQINVEGHFEYNRVNREFDHDNHEFGQLLKYAFEHRPELKRLNLQAEASEKMISVAKAGNKPNLALLSSYEANKLGKWTKSETDWRKTKQSWNVVLALDIPIFDGFLTKSRVKEAQSNLKQSHLSKSQMEENIRLELKSAHLALQETESLIEAQQETVQQAQEGLRIANLQYSNGSITSVQLIDAQLALTQAEVNRLQVLHDYNIAVAKLNRAAGKKE